MIDNASVSMVMTSEVISVAPGTSVGDVARLMVQHGVSGVPVVQDDRLVGIVTEMDVVSKEIDIDPPAYGTFLDAIFKFPWDESDEQLRRVLATTAGELMTREVKTLQPDDPLREAADMMFKNEVNPVPVVDHQGRLVGIISRSDIVRVIADASDSEVETP
jgi:CBS domain-containing protein